MTITPGELLETSIGQLQTLVAFLGEQLDGSGGGDTARSSSLEVRACQDILISLTVLLQGTSGRVFGAEPCPAKLNRAGSYAPQGVAPTPSFDASTRPTGSSAPDVSFALAASSRNRVISEGDPKRLGGPQYPVPRLT